MPVHDHEMCVRLFLTCVHITNTHTHTQKENGREKYTSVYLGKGPSFMYALCIENHDLHRIYILHPTVSKMLVCIQSGIVPIRRKFSLFTLFIDLILFR